MHISLRKVFSALRSRRSRFTIAEVYADRVRLAQISLNREAKEIIVHAFREITQGGEEGLRAAFRKMRLPRQSRALILADAGRTHTVYASLTQLRERPQEPIDEGDLDNLVSQAIWKYFDRNRGRIAKAMGVPEFDLLLSEAHVSAVRLDGHRVVSPLGFKARSFEAQFMQTYLSRAFSEAVNALGLRGRLAGVSEMAPAIARALQGGTTHPSFLLAVIARRETSVAGAEGTHVERSETVPWGTSHLADYIKERLALSLGATNEVLRRYTNGLCSDDLLRRLDALLLEGLEFFISRVLRRLRGAAARALYLYATDPLPPIFFSAQFRRRFPPGVAFHPVRDETARQNFGYTVRYADGAAEERAAGLLLALLERERVPADARLESAAARRVRWLSPL